MENSLKQQTAKGVFWSFFERFSVQGVSFIITIIMARLLTPDDYGVVGMLAVFMSLSQVFIDGGFSSALIQKKQCTQQDFSTVFYINISISILIYLILFLAAPYIAIFFNVPILTSLTRVYTLNLVINSIAAVNKTKLVISVDFKTQSKISLLSAFISGICGVASAILGAGVWAIVIQQMVSAVSNAVLSFVFVRWWPSLLFSKESFHNLFSFGSKLLIATIISSVYANLYNLVIGKKFPAQQLGYYTRADQFVQLISANITGILTRVSFPILSKMQDDNDRLLQVYNKYIQMAAFIMFPLVLGLCGIARPLILVLLTEKWSACIYILQILSFAYLFNGVAIINLNLLYVKGRSDLVLRLEILKKSVGFTILFITLFFSLEILCWGYVVTCLICFYLNTIYTKKLLNYSFFDQLKVILPYLVSSAIILAIAYSFSELIQNPYISLILSLTICPVIYAAMCKIMKLYAYTEIEAVVRQKIARKHE